MFYQNFSHHVTRMHRLTIEGWPLGKLCSPSSINSVAELELLHKAWVTGTARFRRLSDEEWRKFLDDAYDEGSGGTETDAVRNVSMSLNTAPGESGPPPAPARSISATNHTTSKKRRPEPFTDFVNTMAVDGRPVIVQKKARQKRSDAGVARGPRKKKAVSSTGNASAGNRSPVAASASPAAAAASHDSSAAPA
jgi:hypothetical protein